MTYWIEEFDDQNICIKLMKLLILIINDNKIWKLLVILSLLPVSAYQSDKQKTSCGRNSNRYFDVAEGYCLV